MKRGVVAAFALVIAMGLGVSPASGADRFPVSVGITYGSWTPSLDAYNIRFVDQNGPNIVDVNGTFVTIRVREPIDSTRTFFPGSTSEYTVNSQQYLFSSSWGMGVHAKVRLHSDLYVIVEYDWWSQSVGSARNFGGQIGFESYKVKLNPVTGTLVFTLPTEIGNPWWPQVYIGGGAGVVLVERTTKQITSATSATGQSATSSGSGTLLTGLAGLEYPMPFLNDRVSLFFEGRYYAGDYAESFAKLGDTGGALEEDGEELREDVAVSVQGPQIKFGMAVNFGQIRTRAAKGVLSGMLESRGRRSGGYAMMPSGFASPNVGAGMAMVYPQSADQVQVVQGAAQIDENRIRQIIREELLSARVATGGAATAPVNDLAEQQLRSIRERRLQAEQELEQLKELLREES